VQEEDRQRVADVLAAARRERRSRRTELRVLLSDGSTRNFECEVHIAPSTRDGEPLLVSVLRDVSDRLDVKDKLQTRELQLLEAQTIANLGVWEHNYRTEKTICSPTMLQIFGVDESFKITTENFFAFIHPQDRDRVLKALEGRLDTTDGYRMAYRIVRPDGKVRVVDLLGSMSYDESGQPLRSVGVCQDITDRKGTEERARASEEGFRMIVDNVREYALYLIDVNGIITSWNNGAERIKGYTESEILGKHYSCFLPPEHAQRGDADSRLQYALTHGRYEGEGWRLRKSGARFWAHVIVTPLFDETGELRGFSKITHDITDRQRVEEDLRSYAERLRVTSGRLADIQETERRVLAGELHDRVGPNLTALGLNISLIAHGLAHDERPELVERLEESSALVRYTIEAIRNVMEELRPHALDDYGLLAALRPLAVQFHKRTGIRVTVSGEDFSVQAPKPVVIALFRIAQEALNNVAKHSQANKALVGLTKTDGRITLTIEDDGVGMEAMQPATAKSEQGWGQMIMRERAEAVSARFAIGASELGGVRIVVEYRL
jgi:PAS domain S-box-containing protein